MEILNLEGTEDTPKIMLDKKNGIFEISGRSLPEDSAEFYRPVLEWLEKYAADTNPSTEFVFKLDQKSGTQNIEQQSGAGQPKQG